MVTQLATRVATLEIEASELEDALARGNTCVSATVDSSDATLERVNSRDTEEHSSDDSGVGVEFLTGARPVFGRH